MNTDGPDNPLSKVYTKTQAGKLFAGVGFIVKRNYVRYFNKTHYGFPGKLIPGGAANFIGKLWGWHRWIEVVKPGPAMVEKSIENFLSWQGEYGYYSYDQFDFWGSGVGVFSRKLFYKRKILAAPLVFSLQVLESFFPRARILFARKRRFAIGDAHFVLGYLNWYKYTGDSRYKDKAEEILQEIRANASPTPSGIGWGYPYTWVTGRAVYPPGTPFITVTPYCFDAFLEMYDITGEKRHLDTAAAIAQFAAYDLNETVISGDEAAAGYSPIDNSRVINAGTYRAALLLKAFKLFGTREYKEKAIKNINFVLNRQQPDGSWYYADNELFIDHFHTCLVLKNLYKAYLILEDEKILGAVKKGFDYYRGFLFRKDHTPIHLAKVTNPKFRKIEMYDYAEGISLGPLLNPDINGALDFSLELARHLIGTFQLKKGYFVTRVTSLGTRNKVPYLRWPQAQLFYALTGLLSSLTGKK
jgi:hypothetical protein